MQIRRFGSSFYSFYTLIFVRERLFWYYPLLLVIAAGIWTTNRINVCVKFYSELFLMSRVCFRGFKSIHAVPFFCKFLEEGERIYSEYNCSFSDHLKKKFVKINLDKQNKLFCVKIIHPLAHKSVSTMVK